jgi:ABC-type lipoprotein release transport system permease subunit
MFFLTYLRRELQQRMRQAIVIAAGLGLGIGLVITVTALSSGVRTAEGKVLGSLYGVGTDITVTTPAEPQPGRKLPCAKEARSSSGRRPTFHDRPDWRGAVL